MDKETKLPRPPKVPRQPNRPSYERVIENLEKWANSPGLQPPRVSDEDDSEAEAI